MTNYVRNLHPWAAAVYMLMTLILIMLSPYDTRLLLIFALLSVNCICSLGAKKYMKALKLYIVIIFFLAVFNMVFNPKGDTPLLYINDRPFTKEAFLYGMYMGFMVSSMLVWFQLFQDVLDNRKITYLIGSKLPVTGLIISMVFCYYEKFLTKIDKIKEVWNTYAIEATKDPIKKAGIVLSVLLSVMLEDSVDTALSMNARAYGTGKRTNYRTYSLQAMDILLFAASAAMLVFYVLSPCSIHGCLTAFLLLPVIYNIFKELQWKFYQSKI